MPGSFAPLDDVTEGGVTVTIDAALTVHRALGPGFLERAYEQALRLELRARNVAFESQRSVWVSYRDTRLLAQRIDLIVESCVLVEIKAVARLDPVFVSQVVSYLRATELRVGLLINFNSLYLRDGLRRIVL
jgi:GxxExxY protein